MTTKSGSPKFSNSCSVGLMNIFFTKCACHATSTINRTLSLVFSLAPQKASIMYNFLPESCFIVFSFNAFQVVCEMGLLSLTALSDVHQKVSLLWSSSTIYLSFGERPVNIPVITLTAPSPESCPFSNPTSSGFNSSAYKSSNDGL